MASSLSNLLDKIAEEIYKIKCKHGYDEKKNAKRVELNTKVVIVVLNTQTLNRTHRFTMPLDLPKNI